MAASKQVKSIDQIVSDLGRYPLEAFDFLREGLAHAVQKVHGQPSRIEQVVQQWMARNDVDLEQLDRMYESGELPSHIQNLVDKLGGPAALNRHVSGQQLCTGIRDMALERWGLMASIVLRHWHINVTEDFGRMVFALVDSGHLQKRPEDNLDDFKKVYDFRGAFELGYEIRLRKDLDQKGAAKEGRASSQ
jgi:uncharacterized repeat protein (TIGR04138 family)